ncbi:MAG: PepSY-associated TM helix domain-containing protein, partial [Pseudomonadota bacterium]
MGNSLRDSMTLLHTWAGVILGALLFTIFWMGSLSVFDSEIDRWMKPETRLSAPAEVPSLDTIAASVEEILPAEGVSRWQVALPSERSPALQVYYLKDGEFTGHALDPNDASILVDTDSRAGTGFLYPFHYSLHLRWMSVGYWIVGLAGMMMMVLLVSGVIMHRKIFKDFFTFRPDRKLPRATLDLHNVTGVLALPFHFLITLSGLIIFFKIYFPNVV